MKENKKISEPKVVLLISITSDIGTALATRYASEGFTVVGTYRSTKQLNKLTNIPNCHLFSCDINDRQSVARFTKEYVELGLPWDTFISLPASPLPLKAFFRCDFDDWTGDLRLLLKKEFLASLNGLKTTGMRFRRNRWNMCTRHEK